MARYAEHTTVAADKSRAEIERILIRYGADQFLYGWEAESAKIAFRCDGRAVKFLLPLPNHAEFARTEVKQQWRSEEAQERSYEQAVRQRRSRLGALHQSQVGSRASWDCNLR